jgi:hypothetical protein
MAVLTLPIFDRSFFELKQSIQRLGLDAPLSSPIIQLLG